MTGNSGLPPFMAKLIRFAYERLFHEKISDEVESFVKNLSYIAIGTVIATLFGFAFHLLAGRILGPAEYGKFTLVQSVAMFLLIPMVLGFNTAMVKYASEKEDIERQSRIISTTYILAALFTAASVILYFIFSPQLSSIFSISREMLYLSIILAVLSVLFMILPTETLKCVFKMKTLAIFKAVSSAIALCAFLLFIFSAFLSFKSMVYAIFLATGITGAIMLVFFLRNYLRFRFDRSWANVLIRYGSFAVIGGLSYIFYTNVDKIMINRYMTVADVGIYKAYSLASINVVETLLGILITVFFPTASKYKNKGAIFNRINKLIPYLIGLGLPFTLLCEFIILKIYGSQYPFDLGLATLFTIAAIIIVVNGLYMWLMASVGQKGIKVTAFSELISAGVNVGLNIAFIPRIGISGAIIATIISYLVFICLIFSKRRLIQTNSGSEMLT